MVSDLLFLIGLAVIAQLTDMCSSFKPDSALQTHKVWTVQAEPEDREATVSDPEVTSPISTPFNACGQQQDQATSVLLLPFALLTLCLDERRSVSCTVYCALLGITVCPFLHKGSVFKGWPWCRVSSWALTLWCMRRVP